MSNDIKRGPHPLYKIGVWAPCGHDLFPNGILPLDLFKKYGIRFTDFQMVVLPKWERCWFPEMQNQVFPTHYDYGCFQLTEEQYSWITTPHSSSSSLSQKEKKDYISKCSVCAISKWIHESTQRIVNNKRLL